LGKRAFFPELRSSGLMPKKIYNIEDNPKMLASFKLAACRNPSGIVCLFKIDLSHKIDFKTSEKKFTELGLHVGCG